MSTDKNLYLNQAPMRRVEECWKTSRNTTVPRACSSYISWVRLKSKLREFTITLVIPNIPGQGHKVDRAGSRTHSNSAILVEGSIRLCPIVIPCHLSITCPEHRSEGVRRAASCANGQPSDYCCTLRVYSEYIGRSWRTWPDAGFLPWRVFSCRDYTCINQLRDAMH